MSTLSLDLRGSSPSFPSKPASGASLSVFIHGAGIGALVLVPLLTTTAPPETAHSFEAPLVKPITVMLPAPSSPRPRGPRKGAATRTAPAAVADLTVPKDTPTLIIASDVLDQDLMMTPGSTGTGDGRAGGRATTSASTAPSARCAAKVRSKRQPGRPKPRVSEASFGSPDSSNHARPNTLRWPRPRGFRAR